MRLGACMIAVLCGCATARPRPPAPAVDAGAESALEGLLDAYAHARVQELGARWQALRARGGRPGADAAIEAGLPLLRAWQVPASVGEGGVDAITADALEEARRADAGEPPAPPEACVAPTSVRFAPTPLPHLELATATPGAPVFSRLQGCTLVVATPRPGVVEVELAPPAGALGIETRVAWRLGAAGRVIATSGQDADRARVQYVAADAQAAPWRLRLAADGGRLLVSLRRLAGRAPGPLRILDARTALLVALRRADAGAARRALPAARRHLGPALGDLLEAEVALVDASLPLAEQHRRARKLLERALGRDPTLDRARYLLARLDLDDNQARAVEAASPRVGAPAPFLALHARAAIALGRLARAEALARQARQQGTRGCDPEEVLLKVAERRREPRAEEAAARALLACEPGSDAVAELHRQRGEAGKALEAYLALPPEPVDRVGRRHTLIDLRVALGELPRARRELEALLEETPEDASLWLRLADLAAALGERTAAARALDRAFSARSDPEDLLRAHAALGTPSPIAPYRVGRAEVRTLLAAHGRADQVQSPSRMILDRTVEVIHPSGARLVLTHNLIQVLTKEGVQRFGEVEVPEGAAVLAVRTHKRDGTVREAEEIAEKEGVSAPDLDLGDVVELELLEARASAAFPGAFRGERFYFASADAPLVRSEYLLAGASAGLDFDARAGAPQPTAEAAALVMRRTGAPQIEQEPGAPLAIEYLPSVRVSRGLSLDRWRALLAERVGVATRPSEELRSVARKLAPRADAQGLAALHRYVVEQVDQTSTIEEPASAALARSAGNRATLLLALLQAAGFQAELVLARPPQLGKSAELEEFTEPIVCVRLGEHVIPTDTRTRGAVPGQLPAALVGALALRLSQDAPTLAPLPPPLERDLRRQRVSIRVAADRGIALDVEQTESGFLAAERRAQLQQVAREGRAQDLEQRLVGFHYPGGRVTALAWQGEEGTGDVGARFQIQVPPSASPSLRATPFPVLMQRRFVALPARHTDLLVAPPPPSILELDLAVPPGRRVRRAPGALMLDTPFGRYQRTVEVTPGAVRVRAALDLSRARVAPARYADFVRFCAAVDAAEAETVELDGR